MEFDKLVKERHCVRSFKKKKIPSYGEIISAIDAAARAPLAGGISSIRYVLVSDEKKIRELAEAAQQNFIADAPYVIVVCTDKKDLVKSYYKRGEMYARQQAGAAIENLFLKLVDLGLATCWIGAFSDETVMRIVDIPESFDIEAMLPVGYELGKSKPRLKPNLDRVLSFDIYGTTPKKFEAKYMSPRKIIPGSKT